MSEAATIGHNSGADPVGVARERVDQLVAAANKWLASVPEIKDPITAKRCEDFLAQIKSEIDAIETDRKAINKPHEEAVKANNLAWRPLMHLLEKARDLLTPRKTAWLKREQDRINRERAAAQEAARKAAEEAERAKAAAAKSVEDAVRADQAQEAAAAAAAQARRAANAKAHVKGDFAQRASGLRTYWSAIIENYDEALQWYGQHPRVKNLIQQLADADAREFKAELAVPGIKAKSEQKAA